MGEGQGLLSLVTNENGGILDDTVITNAGDFIYMVVNGATKFDDMAHFQKVLDTEFKDADVTMEYLEDSMQLLALQGPGAAAAVAKLLPADIDLVKMPFMTGRDTTLDGIEGCRITRYVPTNSHDYLSCCMRVDEDGNLHIDYLSMMSFLGILCWIDEFSRIFFCFSTNILLRRIFFLLYNTNCRCGYTGEDGFEIAMPAEHAVSIASKLLEDKDVVNPTGLGARDSLRLEAGLCLYGHDLNDTINPIEGALGWTMGPPKSRRRVEGGFLGAQHILTPEGKFQKVAKKRVGLMGMKAPAREHAEIYNAEGDTLIGTVTSGTYSPCLKKPIAMGFVETAHSKVDTEVSIKIRGKLQKAQVTKMPFVPSRYYRVPE